MPSDVPKPANIVHMDKQTKKETAEERKRETDEFNRRVDRETDAAGDEVYRRGLAAKNAHESLLFDVGKIAWMRVPMAWKEQFDERGEYDTSSEKVYLIDSEPKENPAKFTFYYRGVPLGSEAAAYFRKALSQPGQFDPSLLTKDFERLDKNEKPDNFSVEVLNGLRSVIQEKSHPDQFILKKVGVVPLDNQQVLTVTGTYPKEPTVDVLNIYIDFDGTGKGVQELEYRALTSEFPKHIPAVQKVLSSIEWQKKTDKPNTDKK